MKARELMNVDVKFLSLVKKGANRVPFRITKAEGDMIHLGSIFGIKKKEVVPTVVAIGIKKGESFEGLKEAIIAQGFAEPISIDESDDSVSVLKYEDVELKGDEVTVLKMSEDVVVFMKGFSMHTESTSFTENLQTRGFLPGFRLAMGVLEDTILNIAWDEAEQAETVGQINEAIKDFGVYVSGLAGQIPERVFKLENLETKVESKTVEGEPEKTPVVEMVVEDVKKEDTPGDGEVAAVAVAEDAGDGEAGVKTEEGAAVVKTEEAPANEFLEGVKTLLKEALDPITKSAEEAAGKMQALESTVGDLTTSVGVVKKTAEDAASVAKSADEAMRGTVSAGAGAQDGDLQPVVKEEDGMFDGTLGMGSGVEVY